MKGLKEPREFIKTYWDCSSEQLEQWEEKVNKLPMADFDNILDLMEKYAKEAYNLALDKAIELHQESDLPVYYDIMGEDGIDDVENYNVKNYRFELEKLKL